MPKSRRKSGETVSKSTILVTRFSLKNYYISILSSSRLKVLDLGRASSAFINLKKSKEKGENKRAEDKTNNSEE